jgi:hypothetical protein
VRFVELHDYGTPKQIGKQDTLCCGIVCHAKAFRVMETLVVQPFYHKEDFCFSEFQEFPGLAAAYAV